jgi:hypothetical protein
MPQYSRVMTDECCFTRDGILNYHNTHHWADANPHAICQMNSQYRFSVNIWAGIVGTQLIGPYVLPRRLMGEVYLNFLQFNLPELLEEVPTCKYSSKSLPLTSVLMCDII